MKRGRGAWDIGAKFFVVFLRGATDYLIFKFNIILYSKNPVSDFFWYPSQPNYFFLKILHQIIFLGKKPYPPPFFRLNDRSLNAKTKNPNQRALCSTLHFSNDWMKIARENFIPKWICGKFQTYVSKLINQNRNGVL